jgi:hypothetical protein
MSPRKRYRPEHSSATPAEPHAVKQRPVRNSRLTVLNFLTYLCIMNLVIRPPVARGIVTVLVAVVVFAATGCRSSEPPSFHSVADVASRLGCAGSLRPLAPSTRYAQAGVCDMPDIGGTTDQLHLYVFETGISRDAYYRDAESNYAGIVAGNCYLILGPPGIGGSLGPALHADYYGDG